MEIELYIENELKKFEVPFVPMMARRKYNEIQAKVAEVGDNLTAADISELDDLTYSILPDIVFKGQFTLDQLYEGNSNEYINKKLVEAIYGEEQVALETEKEG